MKNLFIPGMEANPEEFKKMKELFNSEGMKIEGILENHAFISKMCKKDIIYTLEKLIQIFSEGKKVNLICHSMGCNFGVMMANHPNVEKLLLVSPEFRLNSKKEQQEIINRSFEMYQNENLLKENSNINTKERLLLLKLFLQSQRWAQKKFNDVRIPVMVSYSEGDPFISRKGIEEIASKAKDIRIVEVETSLHNPFMSKDGKFLVKKIKNFFE